jgi:hypothetical protein
MRILLWHVHGGWTDAFVRGEHEYLLPTLPEAGAWGLGRGGRDWPANAIEIDPGSLRDAGVDVVVLQRPEEIAEAERLLGRRLGSDVPAVFLEHNTPKEGAVPNSVHPLAERTDIPIVHVTHFNALYWDTGRAPSTVIEHGIVDPGPLYTGELARLGVVVNEPVRRWRVTGTDLLPAFAEAAPVDVFGMGTDHVAEALEVTDAAVRGIGDIKTARLHPELARRRVYVHPLRWTSLGLSLLEAMHLGMPVVALGTTEAWRAVPPEAGAISTDVRELVAAARRLVEDPDEARARGAIAREAVLSRYSLARFLADWDQLLGDVADSAAPLVGSIGREAR